MINGLITKNIAYEIGFNKLYSSDNIGLTFEVGYRYKCDHKGFFFVLYIWEFGFEFNIYDIRHKDVEPICKL